MMRIITLNINGIKSKNKQVYLNQFLNKNRPDIVALQETNIYEFPGLHADFTSIINHNVENSRSGTMIIHKKEMKIIKIEKAGDGRILRVEFKNFIIVNIYAPTQNETAANRHIFFLQTLPKFLRASDENLIILGDFNSIIDPRDREGTKKKLNFQLKNLVERLKLADAFRIKNPDSISFTFISPNGKSRIDRIYVQCKNKFQIRDCKHTNFTFSDHQAVILDLEGEPKKQERKKQIWKLNISILDDPEFQSELKNFILNAKYKKGQYRNITQWWEKEVKENFKSFCMTHSRNKRKESNSTKQFYEKCLDQVKAEIDKGENNFEDYYYFKNFLKSMYIKEEEGKKIRGKLNYFIGNETSGVANLIKEKTNGENRILTELEDNEAGTENPDVHQTIYLFYKKLYSLSDHNPMKRHEIIENSNAQVTHDMNLDLVKKITEGEVRNAIETMPKNKSPGIDGLPVEFYIKIWPWLKQCLTIS